MKIHFPCLIVLLALPGQAAVPPASPKATPPAITGSSQPPIPKAQSPVNIFRSLLSMSQAERSQYLATKTSSQRSVLESKIKEYNSMSPNEREIRLKVTEIRWYLSPLMKLPPAERAASLQLIPEEDRPFVRARLELWDLYPRPLQQEVLENDFTLRLANSGTNFQRALEQVPVERRPQVEVEVTRWASLSPEERERRGDQFNRFFELSDQERRRTLQLLSPLERQQMEKTLQTFEKLPREKRDRCLEAFHKFANLSPGEREEFLKNASRWESMTPDERQTWRLLVQRLPEFPPLPTSAQPSPRPLLTDTNN